MGCFAALALFGGTAAFSIAQQSMIPAYSAGDRVLVDKLFFRANGLRRGDVVIVRFSDAMDSLKLERIIGLPGEQVQIRDGSVLINGKSINEPYLAQGTRTATIGRDTWQLGSQEYFVMGDNRSASSDSRLHGPVNTATVIGRVLMRYA